LERVETCQAALGGVSLDSLASDLSTLAGDPRAVLRVRRQKLTAALDTAHATAAKASTAFTLAAERSSTAQTALEAAIVARDTEVARFPLSLTTELSAAQAAAATASEEQNTIAVEVASLENIIAEQTAHIEAAISGARAAVGRARTELELAEGARTKVLKGHATEGGRLEALRKQREAQDLQGAERSFVRHRTDTAPCLCRKELSRKRMSRLRATPRQP
jgi:hypothetical protein